MSLVTSRLEILKEEEKFNEEIEMYKKAISFSPDYAVNAYYSLAEAYKNKLLAENKQGESAGMGLIEISKYSSEKLKYSFKPVNGTLTFFSLSITV